MVCITFFLDPNSKHLVSTQYLTSVTGPSSCGLISGHDSKFRYSAQFVSSDVAASDLYRRG